MGFSIPGINTPNVTFINTNYVHDPNSDNWKSLSSIAETLIHEHTHEAFKYVRISAFKYATFFNDVMFELNQADGEVYETKIWKMFDKRFSFDGGFLAYFNKHYGYKPTHYKITSNKKLFDLLFNSNDPNLSEQKQRSINEVTAQMSGILFSNREIYTSILQGKSKDKYVMYELYDKIINETSISQNAKDYLEGTLKEFKSLFNKYLQKMEGIFPRQKKYTLQVLNNFIKEFTDGQFTTRKGLLESYFEEISKKVRGDATIAIDNIIYLGSIFGSKIQGGVETYANLSKEFKNYEETIEYLLNNETPLLVLENISTEQRSVVKDIGLLIRVLNGKYKGNKEQKIDDYRLKKIINKIEDIVDAYENDNLDKAIEIFELPNKDVVLKAAYNLIDELNIGINMINDPLLGIIDDYSGIEKAFNVFNAVTDSIGKHSQTTFGNYRTIINGHKAMRNSLIKNIVAAIDKKMKSIMSTIMSNSLQKKSDLNEELREVEDIIRNIRKTVNNNAMDYNKMRIPTDPNSIDNLLERLTNIIRNSKMIGIAEFQSLEFVEGDTEMVEEVKANVLQLRDNLINETLFRVYEQFGFLFKDKEFIIKQYPNEKKYKYGEVEDLVKFNEKIIANNLAEIMMEFRMDYDTSLEKGLSLDAMAIKNSKQIEGLPSEPANTKGMNGMRSHVMPPQEIMETYIQIFGSKMDFFQDFYDAYKKSVKRREHILASWERAFPLWERTHKEHFKNSAQVVPVSTDHLIQMRSTESKKIKEELKTK